MNEIRNKKNYNKIGKTKEPMEPIEAKIGEEVKDVEPCIDPPREPICEGIVVNCSNLNMRETPSLDAKVLKTISAGTRVLIIEKKNGWTHYVRNDIPGCNGEGWSMSEYIKEV